MLGFEMLEGLAEGDAVEGEDVGGAVELEDRGEFEGELHGECMLLTGEGVMEIMENG